jgi:hypothetical protein
MVTRRILLVKKENNRAKRFQCGNRGLGTQRSQQDDDTQRVENPEVSGQTELTYHHRSLDPPATFSKPYEQLLGKGRIPHNDSPSWPNLFLREEVRRSLARSEQSPDESRPPAPPSDIA